MPTKCETCGNVLGVADFAAGRCPNCRTRVKRSAAERTLAAAGDVQGGATMLPTGSSEAEDSSWPALADPSEVGGNATIDTASANPGRTLAGLSSHPSPRPIPHDSDSDDEVRSAATLDSSPAADPVRTSATLPTADPPTAAPPQRRHVRTAATLLSAEPASPAAENRTGSSRDFGTAATVDPRYFDSSDWKRWGGRLGKGTTGSGDVSSPSRAAGRESSTDSKYVGKTPVASRSLTKPGEPPTPGVDYALAAPLGAGGMGIVYEAIQRSVNRSVALKMLKPEAARRRDRRDSLASEAIVTGELAHPNIVPIYDLGQDADGNLFYSMKRVEGDRWDSVLKKKTEAENLDVFLKVCDAIAFAHARAIVHRDLKPENVLLGGFGEVLVMDWGLAYPTDDFAKLDSITENASMGGSPAYMAPEQARNFLVSGGWRAGTLEPITPAIDVYLLGAILFEIAVGEPPHAGDDPTLCVAAAAENRIRAAESESGLLPIALKAMATVPADRYASVAELQHAVREFSAHAESIALADRAQTLMKQGDLARAVVGFEDALALWSENPEATSRIKTARRRLSRRRYALTAVSAAFFLAVAGGGSASTFFWRQAEGEADRANNLLIVAEEERDKATKAADEERRAKQAEEKAKVVAIAARDAAKRSEEDAKNARDAAVDAAEKEKEANDAAQMAKDAALAAAEEARKAKDAAQKSETAALAAQALAEREKKVQQYLNYHGRIKLIDERIEENAFAEANRLLDELADQSPELCGWEWGRLKYLCTQGRQLLDVSDPVLAAAVAADGSFFVTGDADGLVRLWDRDAVGAQVPTPRLEFAGTGLGRITALAVAPDSRTLAAAGTGSADVLLWRTDSQARVAPVRLATGYGAGRNVVSLSYSADGSRLLSAGTGGLILWTTADGKPLARKDAGAAGQDDLLPVSCAALSPDGTAVAAGHANGEVLVWNVERAADGGRFSVPRNFDGHRTREEFGDGFRYLAGVVTAIAFLPDGQSLLSAGDDGRLLRWAVSAAVPRDDKRDLTTAFSRADAARKTGRAGETKPTVAAEILAHARGVSAITVVPGADGRPTAVTAGADGLVKVWIDVTKWPDGRSEQTPAVVLRGHDGRVTAASAFDPTDAGLVVFSAGEDASVRLWDLDRYKEVAEIRPEVTADHEQEILAAGFDPTGRQILSAGRDEALVVTGLGENAPPSRRSPKVHSEAISVPWVVPFPDGGRLATGYLDGSVAVWDVAARTTLARIAPGLGSSLMPPAVSPDGRWLAASSSKQAGDRFVAVWSVDRLTDPTTAEPEPDAVFEPRGEVFAAAFTPDGKVVFGDRPGPSRPAGGHVYVGDPQTKKLTMRRVFGDGVEGRIHALEVLPDGAVLVAGGPTTGTSVRIVRFDPASGKTSGKTLVLPGNSLVAMSADHDGRRLATLSNVGRDASQSLQMWDLASGEPAWEIPLADIRAAAIDVSPDGRTLLLVTEPVRLNGGNVVTTGPSNARLLDAATGEERRFGQGGDEPLLSGDEVGVRVSGGVFSADGRRLFLAGLRGVTEWDVAGRERLPGTFGSHGAIPASGFSSDGRFIVSGQRDGSFDVRDASSAQLNPIFHQPAARSAEPVSAATFSPEPGSYRFLIASGNTLTLWAFDPEKKSAARVRDFGNGDATELPKLRSAAFSHDGVRVAAACEDGKTRVWEVDAQGKPLVLDGWSPAEGRSPVGHRGPINTVAFARGGVPEGFMVIATGGTDRSAVVWIVEEQSGRIAAAVPLRGHRGEVTDLAFAPGRSDRLVTASTDETAKLWDWDRGGVERWNDAQAFADLVALGDPDEALTLAGRHTAGLTAVDLSADGRTVLTAGRDGRAVLWPAVVPPAPPADEPENADDAPSP